jgi:hypothetical protein
MPDDGVGEAHGLSHRGNQETKPQLSWEEAIHDIEQEIGTEDKRYAHAQRQQEWRNRFHEAGLQDMAQRMQWEIDLFELVGRPPWENEDPYFRPAAAYSDGSSWPQIDSFTDEMLDYVEERANVTQNPILKARYSDVIWERRKRHECARQAVGGYLAAANHYARLGWGIETAKAIARALELCLHLNDKELLAQPLSLLRSLLLRFTKADDPQRGLELADIALKLPSSAWAPSLDNTSVVRFVTMGHRPATTHTLSEPLWKCALPCIGGHARTPASQPRCVQRPHPSSEKQRIESATAMLPPQPCMETPSAYINSWGIAGKWMSFNCASGNATERARQSSES